MRAAGRLARRISVVRGMVERRQWVPLFERLSSAILPPGNPIAFWDKYLIARLVTGTVQAPGEGPLATVATSDDIDQLCRRVPTQAPRFRRRIADGHMCFVVKERGLVVARAWLIPERASYTTNGGLRFVPDIRPSGWWHDVYIEPARRGQGLMMRLVGAACCAIAREGREAALFCEIHFLNERSLAAHRRCGFTVCNDVLLLGLTGARVSLVWDRAGHRSTQVRWTVRGSHN